MAKGAKGKSDGAPNLLSTLGQFDTSDLQDLLRSLEHSMRDGLDDETLDRAQEKAFEAMEAASRPRRIALAKEALAISPLCSDGYYVLGLEAKDPQAALAFFRDAVRAGTEALGERAFEEDVGDFWGLIETRPYMRARHMLAMTLWQTGGRDEAIDHYREMLRLNPNDNQGIRYLLMDALLAVGRDGDAAGLWRQYKGDGSAAWTWSKALMEFRRFGDGSKARNALAAAVAANPYVAAFLTGQKKLPRTLPDFVGFGDKDEAVAYVAEAQEAWAATVGALPWVASHAGPASPKSSRRPSGGEAGDDVEVSTEAIDQAVLALLYLNEASTGSAWKGFDWNAMDRLYEKGLISNPAKKARSVTLTDNGMGPARQAFRALFAKRPARGP